jgi:hypothetical protein
VDADCTANVGGGDAVRRCKEARHLCKEQGACVIENDAERESVAFRTA